MENPHLRAALYFPRRMVWGVLTLLIVPTLIFGILQYAMSGETPYPPQVVERLGLDRPMWERYTEYLGGLLRGDLGQSMMTQRPVTVMIGERLPATLTLVRLALFVTVLFSVFIIVLGVLVLVLRARVSIAGTILQRLGQLVVAIVMATPIFLVGMYLLWFFALRLEWFPMAGLAAFDSGRTFELKHAVLPVLTLAVLPACLTARAVLGEIARFQSCSGRLGRLVVHAILSFLENTLGQAVGVVGGMLLVESLFSLPGIGLLAFQSAYSRDLLVLHGLFYWFAALALFLRGMATVVHGIDGFVLPPLLAAERDVGKQSPTEKPRYKILAWLWIGFCLLLILVPVARGVLGIVTGQEAAQLFNPADRNLPPGSQSASGRTYAWGTDVFGRDVRTRALYALGVDLLTSFAVALAVSIPGLGLGLLAGALVRRRALWADVLDDLLMFPWDVLASWPGLVLLALVLALGQYSLLGLLIWLGLAFLLPRCVRMVRSAWASGLSHTGLWLRLVGVFVGALAFAVGLAVVMQSALGFIGLGVPLPTPDLGGMFNEGLRSFITNPQTVLRPGLLLISAGVGWFLLADTVLSRFGVHTRGTWTAPNR
jgi:peptide/nickel transport system permease protein